MKFKSKRLFAFLLSLLILASTITVAFAETIYNYSGIYYTYITNELVSIYGVEESKSEVVIPGIINTRAVVDIRNNAFMKNETLTSLDLSKALYLERIGSFAFSECKNLGGTLTIPSSVSSVDIAAFQYCSSLESVVYEAQSDEVPNQCFKGCALLSSVTLNDNITRIGYYAFSDCPNLSYMVIPKTVTTIASSAFNNDSSLTLGVYYDSTAHQYAENKGIPYIILDPPVEPTEPPTEPEPTEAPTDEPTVPATEAPTEMPVKYLGDVDGDGTVTSIDATLIQRHLCYIKTMISDKMFMMGDVDGDGIITIIDVSYIMRYLATIEVPYPIGDPIINN